MIMQLPQPLIVLLILVGTAIAQEIGWNETANILGAPAVPRDRFRLIQADVNEQRLNDVVEDFTNYGCEKLVIIRNKAQAEARMWCRSHHDAPKMITIQAGNAFVFSFRPQKKGSTVFWCTVEYKQQFARFDVYNERLHYMCPRDVDEIYQYTIHHEGVFVDGAKGNEDTKIRALFKGHNKFILWEEFENNETDGFLISGLVDGGMCSDIPEQFNDKTAAVTVCYKHCVLLYEHYGCMGKVQMVQANDDCIDVGLNSELENKLSAVKGC